jgi:hypothetical protein
MALITTHTFYIDTERGVAYGSYGNFALAPTPVFYDGDTAKLEVYLVRPTGKGDFPFEDVTFPSSSITAAVGTPGGTAAASGTTWSAISSPTATYSSPTLTVPRAAIAGYYTLSITNGSPSLSATTASLPYNANSSAIEAAIEAAINGQSGWSAADATVTQTGAGKFTVTAKGTNSTTVYSLTVAIGTSALVGPSGYTGEVAFTGSGVDTLLGSATEVDSTFEVQVADSSKYQTYLQIPCILRKQVTSP